MSPGRRKSFLSTEIFSSMQRLSPYHVENVIVDKCHNILKPTLRSAVVVIMLASVEDRNVKVLCFTYIDIGI